MNILKILIACENEHTNKKLIDFVAPKCSSPKSIINAHEAMNYIVEHRPQIVVLSENLADMTAHDFIVLASQKKVFSTTTFLLLSLHPYPEIEKMKMMTLGFSSFITYDLEKNDLDNLNQFIEDELKITMAA